MKKREKRIADRRAEYEDIFFPHRSALSCMWKRTGETKIRNLPPVTAHQSSGLRGEHEAVLGTGLTGSSTTTALVLLLSQPSCKLPGRGSMLEAVTLQAPVVFRKS